ncbi:hypothetical protein [Streptomyces sp. R35]|uniref:Integrase catalytic domain-containing protein n=1 Tax=Streptomyces sp. R35 TaxID=3238630 RepID=A0AB39SHK0_9ACTN
MIDLCSQRLARWAIADHMRTELVIDALAAAERTRGSLNCAVMHADHGAQVHEQGLRGRLPPGGRAAEHEWCRKLGGQCCHGELQRDLQTRDVERPKGSGPILSLHPILIRRTTRSGGEALRTLRAFLVATPYVLS